MRNPSAIVMIKKREREKIALQLDNPTVLVTSREIPPHDLIG